MFIYYDETSGAISYTIQSGFPVNRLPAGTYIEVEDSDIIITDYKVINGELIESLPPITGARVNIERDRRLNTTFIFQGVPYDCDQNSLARITGAATLAGFAIGAGAPAGYYRWHGGDTDFMWIANDNSLNVMDAQTCFALGQAAASNQSAHIFAADILKRQNPIPRDYTDDSHWP